MFGALACGTPGFTNLEGAFAHGDSLPPVHKPSSRAALAFSATGDSSTGFEQPTLNIWQICAAVELGVVTARLCVRACRYIHAQPINMKASAPRDCICPLLRRTRITLRTSFVSMEAGATK